MCMLSALLLCIALKFSNRVVFFVFIISIRRIFRVHAAYVRALQLDGRFDVSLFLYGQNRAPPDQRVAPSWRQGKAHPSGFSFASSLR